MLGALAERGFHALVAAHHGIAFFDRIEFS
jgi:hypothetical protein